MGEYANLQIREDMKRMTGFDPGPIYDNETPKQRKAKPVYKRVKCPHCDAHPKECGLWQHIRDAHGISKVDQAIAKATKGGAA